MDVTLPKLGEGADAGVVVGILVQVGESVKKGQALIELENEKAVAPIPSPAAGRVQAIFVKQGQTLSVGQRILAVTVEGETAVAPPATTPESPVPLHAAAEQARPVPVFKPDEDQPQAPTASPEHEPILPVSESVAETETEPIPSTPAASPSIRKLARELGIDLARVRGSERGGRIVMKDLRAYVQRLQQIAQAPKAATPPAPTPPPAAEVVDFSQWGPVTRKPLTPLRATISRRLVESWTTLPHVTQFDEADITALLELRKKHSAAYEAKGLRLTLTPFTLKAAVRALKQYPIFNASLDESGGEIIFKEYYHLGLAVDTEAGLIVPVLRDVDRKGLLDLAQELQELTEKTRGRKVTAEDLKGGTFTISNQGGIGGGHFTPIINKPQVAILGIGRSALKPVVRQGAVVPRMMLPLALSYDHRLIDGADAARFIVCLVQTLENFPEEEVLRGFSSPPP